MENPQRILLIEDCRCGMSQTFSQFAFARNPAVRMNLAANLYDAGNRLRGGGFSLILLNLRLPDYQGVETFRRFEQIGANTPVAILLQDDEWHLEKEVRAMGAVGVFSTGRVPVDEALKLCGTPGDPLANNSAVEVAGTLLAESDDESAETSSPNQPIPTEPSEQNSAAIPTNDKLSAFADIDVSLTSADLHSRSLLEEISEADAFDEDDYVALETLADLSAAKDTISIEIPDAVPPYAINAVHHAEKSTPTFAPADAAKISAVPQVEKNKPAKASAPLAADKPVAPLIASATDLSDADIGEPQSERTKSEIVRLRKEIFHYRAVRQEIEGVNRALEERCRELEAGQAALIEAEHVAIEREKAAKELAEQRAEQAIAEREKEIAVYRRRAAEFEEHYQEVQAKLTAAVAERDLAAKTAQDLAAKENAEVEKPAAWNQELSAYRQRADLFEKQYRELELRYSQLTAATNNVVAARATAAKSAANAAETNSEDAEKVAALTAQNDELKARFAKLERAYHETGAEKKNAEKKSEALALTNADLLRRVNEMMLLCEQLGAPADFPHSSQPPEE